MSQTTQFRLIRLGKGLPNSPDFPRVWAENDFGTLLIRWKNEASEFIWHLKQTPNIRLNHESVDQGDIATEFRLQNPPDIQSICTFSNEP